MSDRFYVALAMVLVLLAGVVDTTAGGVAVLVALALVYLAVNE